MRCLPAKPLRLALSLLALAPLALICAPAPAQSSTPATRLAEAPVVATEQARDALPNDYLRVSFVPPSVKVTSLGKPGAIRAFLTATPLYEPPLKLTAFPTYSGLVNNDTQVLVAMRCRPPKPDQVDAVLATWPNVFDAITRDVQLPPGACALPPASTDIEMACYASRFEQKRAFHAAPTALAYTFSYAGRLFEPDHLALARWLQDKYGIYPAFSGTGYSVKDSYTLDTDAMTPDTMLVKSASSEYLLRSVPLADAGCRCISVDPYQGRSDDLLDPVFIEREGGDGVCRPVPKLRSSAH